ncbi:MAG: ribonuclease P protein component [Patescibacteria group bacterium]|nr:ribonuclease P protein component [Patescibacteria group bacterium]
MLSKKNRFPLKKDFTAFKTKAALYQSPIFGLLVLENKEDVLRFGFIVSKKIDKRAVVRNRIKRVLSEAVFLNLGKIKHGYDFVFLAKKEILGNSFSQVSLEIEKLFSELGFYEG